MAPAELGVTPTVQTSTTLDTDFDRRLVKEALRTPSQTHYLLEVQHYLIETDGKGDER